MSPSVGQTYIPNPLSFFKKDQIDIETGKMHLHTRGDHQGKRGNKIKRPLQKETHGRTHRPTDRPSRKHRSRTVPVGNQGQQTQVYTTYHFEIPLDEEAVYYHEFYPFEIHNPI